MKAIFDTERDELRSHVWNIVLLHARVLTAIWLLVLGSIVAGRQVARGFSHQRAERT